ncbi:hypothetical protein GXW82_43340 [Streptacidiphilus sp. 4-A2]|nr:hypothetical protein [Streptacidiphilus sp. 4-A2]
MSAGVIRPVPRAVEFSAPQLNSGDVITARLPTVHAAAFVADAGLILAG